MRCCLLALLLVPVGCQAPPAGDGPSAAAAQVDPARTALQAARQVDAANRALDAWHAAAAAADLEAYFALMSEDAVFLGTDATERWSRAEFRAYAQDVLTTHGVMWTIRSSDRSLVVEGDLAWFDESLSSDKYPPWRGTGVLRREADGWRVVHYSMSFTIPNGVTDELGELLRARAGAR